MFQPILSGIQIHHVRNNHWITSCSTNGCVQVCDSIYNSLSEDTAVQLSDIYHSLEKTNKLEVNMLQCQHQTGSTDCGLFAIAWAVEFANGNKPENVTFDQKKMRAHLIQCIDNGKILRFPQARVSKRKFRDNSSRETIVSNV